MDLDKGEVTDLLKRWGTGDAGAFEQLMPKVYNELKRLAGHYLRMERPNHTLQRTALVHEAYLRLADMSDTPWADRRHFFAAASRVIRHILVDYARHHEARKRDHDKVPLEDAVTIPAQPEVDLVALNDALEHLGRIDTHVLQVVELRFFSGLSVAETAKVMGTSAATVKRAWGVAKLFLYKHMYGAAA